MSDELEQEEATGLRAKLAEEARGREVAETELAALKSRELFRDAGLDLANPQHRAFTKAYDGELTSEAVDSYVTELGIKSPEPTPPPVPLDEQAALIRIAEAARDSGTPPPSPDREAAIKKEMEVAARRGDNAALDRLSEELTHARGFRTKWDISPS